MSRAVASAPVAEAAPAKAAATPPRTVPAPDIPLRPAFDVRVIDDDAERAAIAAALLRRLADALGLDRNTVHVRADPESGRIVRPHAARGALVDDVVRLDPLRFDPRASASRYVLAHELTHLAQSRIAAPAGPLSVAASEREAHETALALLATGTAPAPRHGLPPGLAVFDAGAEKVPTAETGPKAKEPSFEATVQLNYAAELKAISDILDDVFITDGQVDEVLGILEPLAFETATTLIAQLTARERKDYIRNMGTSHRRSYRREVLASYGALSHDEAKRFDEELFEDMPLDPASLGPAERHTAVRVLRMLPPKALLKLDQSANGENIRTLRTSVLPDYDRTKERQDQFRLERLRQAALDDAKGREGVAGLLIELRRLLADASEDSAREALDLIGGYKGGTDHDPRFARPATPADATKKDPAKKDEAVRIPDLRLDYVIAILDGEGLIEKLVKEVAPTDRHHAGRRDAFLNLLRHRRPDRNLRLARDLLTSFLWVSDREAELAYDILIALPPAEQDRFRRFDEGALFKRLYDELPDEFKRGKFFHGLEARRNAEGQLADVAEEYGRLFGAMKDDEAIATLIEDFEAGISEENSYNLFVRLLAVGRPPPGKAGKEGVGKAIAGPPPQDRLRSLVRHLDARGFIQSLIGKLSAGVLQDRRYWNDLGTIFAARDPAMNALHARELLHNSFFDKVHREEALLAFQIFRSLPAADREELSRAENGKMWERLTGALTRDMVQELGLSYARTTTDGSGENALRKRLADPRTWAETNVRELALLAAMKISAGDFDWLFWQSRTHRAWEKKGLQPLVARFELYDAGPANRLFPHPHIASAAHDDGSFLKAAFGTRAYELDFNIRAVPGPDPFTGEPTHYQEFEGMRATVDLEQLEDVAGGWLATNYELEKSGGERLAIDGDNREQALAQSNVVDVQISAEQGMARITARRLALSRFAYLTPETTVRTGPVTAENLFVEIRFADKDLREPNSARLSADKVEAEEIVVTSGDDVYGAQALRLSDPRMEGAFEVKPLPDSPVLGPLFGFIANLLDERNGGAGNGMAIASLAISFSSLRLEGFQTSGGLSIAAVSVEGAALAAGGNRAAYKRALRAALASRLAASRKSGDTGTAATLTKKMADIDAELPALEAQERELLGLIRKMNRAGGVLQPADEQRLAKLQEGLGVGAAGGLVADIGAIRVEGVDGKVRLKEGTLRDISGSGESAALAFKQLTDAGAIEKFIREGPPNREQAGAAGLSGDVSFGVGGMTLAGLVIPGAIPSSSQLRERLARLNRPPLGADPDYGPMRRQMQKALDLVEEYERLHAESLDADARGHFDRSPESQARLNDLAGEIGDIIDLKIDSLTVSGPSLTLGRNAQGGAIGLDADTVTALGISKLGLSIKKAEATGFGVSLNVDWPEAVLGEPTRSLLSARGKAKSLVFEGIRSDSGVAVDRLGLHNLNGTVLVQDGGILLQGLSIDRIDVTGADYSSPTQRVWSHGTTVLNTLTADIFIPFKPRAADAEAVRRGSVLDADFSTFNIVRLGIKTIAADRLGYESLSAGPDGGSAMKYRVEVESGEIGGVELTNFEIWMPPGADTEMAGDVDIATFTKARFAAAYKNSLTSSGTLDRGVDEAGSPGVHVSFVRKGAMTVDLDKLQFTGTEADLPDKEAGRGITITRTDLSGQFVVGDTTTAISGLRIDRMELSRVDWRMESGATVKADGATVLEAVNLSATYRTLPEDKAEFQIDRFRIGKMTGTHLVYRDPPLTVELTPSEKHKTALELTDIVVTDLLVGMDPDKTTFGPSKDKARGNVRIATSRFDFVADYAKDLKATGILRANAIKIGIGPNGEIGARSTDANVSAALTYDDKKGTTAGAKLEAKGIDTGDISYAAGIFSLGANGGAGLSIPSIATSELKFDNPQMTLDGGKAGTATLSGIDVALDVNLHRTEGAQKAEGTPFRNIVVRRLNMRKISGTGLHIHLKDMGIHLDFPPEKDVHVGPVSLQSATEGDTAAPILTITPVREVEPAAEGKPAKASVKWGFSGLIELKDFAAERAQAQISSMLNTRADLSAPRITVGFPAGGGTNIDVYQWAALNLAGYAGNDPAKKVKSKGVKGDRIAIGKDSIEATNTQLLDLGYEDPASDNSRITLGGQKAGDEELAALVMPRIRYDTAKKEVEVEPVTLNGFTYRDDDFGGTTFTFKKLSTQDTRKITAELNAPGGAKKIRIPRLRVEEAELEMADLARSLHPSPPATSAVGDPYIGKAASDWIDKNPALFDALQGDLTLAGRLEEVVLAGKPDFDFGNFSLSLPITNGLIDYQQIHTQVLNPAGWPFSSIHFFVNDPATGTATLRLGLSPDDDDWNVEWELPGGELASARSNQMRLDRLARARDPSLPPPPPGTPASPTGPAAGRMLELNTIGLRLDIRANKDFAIDLGAATKAVMAANGLTGLRLDGELQPVHAGETNQTLGRAGQLRPHLGSINLVSLSHTQAIKSGGSAVINTGAIEIGRVHDATIDFAGWTAHRLHGKLESLDIRDAEINLSGLAKGGPDPAFTPLELDGVKPKEPPK